jgi:lysophospholipase L1-like esterase
MKKLLFSLALFVGLSSTTVQNIKWVAIGDSITYLNDHPEQTGNRVKKGYLTRVTEKLPNISYINQGHNGWTAIRIAEKIEDLKIEKADIYTVFLGTNDWWGGKPLGTLADYENNTGIATVNGAFRVILDKLKSLNKDAKIVLITPMQRGDFVHWANMKNNAFGSYKTKNGQSLEQFVEALKAIGKIENLAVVDLHHNKKLSVKNAVKYKLLNDPKTGKQTKYKYPEYTQIPFNPEKDPYPYPEDAVKITYDGLHPSDEGNEIIARLLVKEIKRK